MSQQMPDVISADQFKEAVHRSGRQKTELARLLGVERTAIYWYETKGVTRTSSVETVRRVMALWLTDEAGEPLAGFSDDDLLNELRRRLVVAHGARDASAP